MSSHMYSWWCGCLQHWQSPTHAPTPAPTFSPTHVSLVHPVFKLSWRCCDPQHFVLEPCCMCHVHAFRSFEFPAFRDNIDPYLCLHLFLRLWVPHSTPQFSQIALTRPQVIQKQLNSHVYSWMANVDVDVFNIGRVLHTRRLQHLHSPLHMWV